MDKIQIIVTFTVDCQNKQHFKYESFLEENLEREKHNGTLRERIKSIGVDSMSAENEGARFKKLLSEMKSEVKEESMKKRETKNVDDRNAQPKKNKKEESETPTYYTTCAAS